MKTFFKGCLLATGLGIIAVPVSATAQDGDTTITPSSFRLSTGISYSSGDYGEIEDTDVLAVPVSMTFKQRGLKLRVSVPWVHVDGPGSLISTPEGRDGGSGQGRGRGRGRGGDSDNSGSGSFSSGSGSGGNEVEVEDEDEDEVLDDDDDDIFDDDDDILPGDNGDNTLAADNTRSGIGDVNVTASYSFDLGGELYLEPGVKLKIPTASRSKRLGTGKFDVTLSADIVKDVGAASFYLHGRRKFAGKPTGSTIRSTWGAGGGASVRVGPGVAVGADYDWQQSAFAGRQASSEATAWAYTRLNRNLGLTLYASTGFNQNSADFSGGASISYRF
ncbi:MAG: transporter [Sphingomonadaceae bacterium]